MSFLSSIVFNSLKSSVNLLKMQQIYKQEEFLRSSVDKKPSKNNFEEEEKLNPDNSAKRFQYENYELNSSIVQLDPGPTEKPEKVPSSKVSPLKSLNNLDIQHHLNNPKAGKNPQCLEMDDTTINKDLNPAWKIHLQQWNTTRQLNRLKSKGFIFDKC